MSSLLQRVPQPLINDFLSGKWLPIVGAGFSRNASVPSGELPVTWASLGASLAADLGSFDPASSALEVISAYQHAYDREKLVDRAATLIRAHDARPGQTHEAFARLGQFDTVITTNFDFLLEHAYELVSKRCVPIVEESQLSATKRTSGPKLIKMHGDVHHPDRMIITEEDYDRFLHDYPIMATVITAMLVDHTPVLIGYSLDDPDTRQLLSLIRSRLGKLSRPLWTIQVDAKPQLVARFERRGVKVINLPRAKGHPVGDQLRLLFEELEELGRQQVADNGIVTDEHVAADLAVGKEGSLLCYFAVPARSLAYYREVAFPIVREYGLTPVSSFDVVTPDGTDATKVDALIQRAICVVVERGNSWNEYEAGLAFASKPGRHILHVTAPGERPYDQSGAVLVRIDPSSSGQETEGVFRQWLSGIEIASRRELRDPERLIRKGEWDAAVVSAVTLLEQTLSRMFPDYATATAIRRPAGLGRLVQMAEESGWFESPDEFEAINSAIQDRNEIVHLGASGSAKYAKTHVQTVVRFVTRMGG